MSEISSKLTKDDFKTLLDAMNTLEGMSNHEFYVLNIVKNAPMPPDDHPAFEQWQQIKDHFRSREKEIRANQEVLEEKCTFLKAKLLLTRRDLGINQLFDLAENIDMDSPDPVKKEKKPTKQETETATASLELAEYFIKDMGKGVWDFYQKFLEEKKTEKVGD